jgi:hypothetical protein
MMVYCKSSFKHKKKKKPRGPIAKKFVSRTKITETYKPPAISYPRAESEAVAKIPSLMTATTFIPSRKSMTDPMTLAKEKPEVRDAIIAKSKRIAIAYSKGAYQYVTDEADAKTIGRKNPI